MVFMPDTESLIKNLADSSILPNIRSLNPSPNGVQEYLLHLAMTLCNAPVVIQPCYFKSCTMLINVFLSKTYMKRQWESAVPSVELLYKIASIVQAMF